jgi:hypothetical protein
MYAIILDIKDLVGKLVETDLQMTETNTLLSDITSERNFSTSKCSYKKRKQRINKMSKSDTTSWTGYLSEIPE